MESIITDGNIIRIHECVVTIVIASKFRDIFFSRDSVDDHHLCDSNDNITKGHVSIPPSLCVLDL